MPPMIIVWIIIGAAAVGSIAGILSFFAADVFTTIVFVVAAIIVGGYLIPFLPDNIAIFRKLKSIRQGNKRNE